MLIVAVAHLLTTMSSPPSSAVLAIRSIYSILYFNSQDGAVPSMYVNLLSKLSLIARFQ